MSGPRALPPLPLGAGTVRPRPTSGPEWNAPDVEEVLREPAAEEQGARPEVVKLRRRADRLVHAPDLAAKREPSVQVQDDAVHARVDGLEFDASLCPFRLSRRSPAAPGGRTGDPRNEDVPPPHPS